MQKIFLALLASGLLLAGCDKKVSISFYNTTNRSLDVRIDGPGKGVGELGTVAPNGGLAATRIEVKKDILPAHYKWKAGEHGGRITIEKGTAKKLWVRIPGGLTAEPGQLKKKHKKHHRSNMGFTAEDNKPENQAAEAANWDGTFDDAVPKWYNNSLKGLKPGVDFNRKDAD